MFSVIIRLHAQSSTSTAPCMGAPFKTGRECLSTRARACACVCTRYTREHGRASITRRRVPGCFIPFAIFHILPTRVRNASVVEVHSSDALPPRHRCRCSAIYGPGEHPNRLRGRRILRFLRRGKHLALEMPAFQPSLPPRFFAGPALRYFASVYLP